MSKHRFKPNRRKQLASFTLSFGRYHGKTLKSIPRSYLRWLVRAEGIPIADVWAASQFLQLEQPQAHIRHGCRNSVPREIVESATETG